MSSETDLNKPLKVHASQKTAGSRLRVLVVVLGLFLMAGIPVAQFYDLPGLFFGKGSTNKGTEQVAVTEPKSEPVTIDLRTSIEDETEATGKIRKEPGTLTELKPQTNALEPLPKPRPVQSGVRQKQVLAHLPDPELVERGAAGFIPKKSPDGLRPMDVYSRQPDTEGNFGVARVVIVIGGLGISQTSTQQAIRELPGGITLAFAPYGNSLARWMQKARKEGHELLLQVPMEPLDYPRNNPGTHTLKSDADRDENLANLHWAMSRMTNYVGIMNYLGNRLLSEPAGLRPVFDDIAERGLLFVEDGTVKNSIGEGMAVRSLLPYTKANVLLDNTRSRAAIAEKLKTLTEQAKRTGLAIGVGNAFPDTIKLVAEFARNASRNGLEITPVSAVVKDPSERQ